MSPFSWRIPTCRTGWLRVCSGLLCALREFWASLPSLIEQLGFGGVLVEPWAESSVAAKSPRGNMEFSSAQGGAWSKLEISSRRHGGLFPRKAERSSPRPRSFGQGLLPPRRSKLTEGEKDRPFGRSRLHPGPSLERSLLTWKHCPMSSSGSEWRHCRAARMACREE